MTVSDRWHLSHPPEGAEPCKCGRGKNKLYPTADHGVGKRWQVRWDAVGEDGKRRQPRRNFAERYGDNPDLHAEAFDAKMTADRNSDNYIDPAAGQTPFKVYAEEVLAFRTLDPGTRVKMGERLAKHVYPAIGEVGLRTLSRRPSMVQALVTRMEQQGLAVSTIAVIMAHVGVVFACAVDDEKITKNPMNAKVVVVKRAQRRKVVPWTAEYVAGMRDQLPAEYAAMVDCGAGIGMRQGEIFAFSPDDVDWLRGKVTIQRQIKIIRSRLVFALPKGEKTREVPLAESVKFALSEQARLHSLVEVTLPWREPGGKPHTARLFFFTAAGGAINRERFNPSAWFPACERAGIIPVTPEGEKRPDSRKDGMHALRHFFASSLLTEGEAIQAVSEWMGHGSPKITLDIYAHLMPQSETRMRMIIDRALARPGEGRCARDVPSQGD